MNKNTQCQLEKLAEEIEKKLNFSHLESIFSLQQYLQEFIDLNQALQSETLSLAEKIEMIKTMSVQPNLNLDQTQLENLNRSLYLAVNDIKEINSNFNKMLTKSRS